MDRQIDRESEWSEGLLNISNTKSLRLAELQVKSGTVPLDDRQLYEAKYLSSFDEASRINGVALLYLGCGIIRLNEGGFSIEAPVYLVPARLTEGGLELAFDGTLPNSRLIAGLKERFGTELELPVAKEPDEIIGAIGSLTRLLRPGWAVAEEWWLMLCDLSAMMLNADTAIRGGAIKLHPIAGSFESGRLSYLPGAIDMEDDGIGELLRVFRSDRSQSAAQNYVAKGGSLLLTGTPGKTVACINAIANALFSGQSVLIAADDPKIRKKYSTLLNECGAGGFWLDITERKTGGQLLDFDSDAKNSFERLNRMSVQHRKGLQAIDQAVTTVRSGGVRYCDAVEAYVELEDVPDWITFPPEAAASLRHDTYMHWHRLCEELVKSAASIGHPNGDPLREIRQKLFSKKTADELDQLLEQAVKLSEEVIQYGNRLSAQWNLPKPVDKEQFESLAEMAAAAAKWEDLPQVWLNCEDMPEFLSRVRELVSRGKKVSDTRARLLCTFAEPALAIDVNAMLVQWTEAEQRLVTRTTVQGRIMKELSSMLRHGVKVDKKQVPGLLNSIMAYQKDQAAIQQILPELGGLLSSFWKDVYTDWIKVEGYCRVAQSIDDRLTEALGSREACAALYARCAQSGDVRVARMLDNAWSRLTAVRTELNKLLDVDETAMSGDESFVVQLHDMYSRFRQNVSRIGDWCKWRLVREQAVDAGLSPVVEAYERGLSHEQVIPSFERGIYLALTKHIVDNDIRLGQFDPAAVESQILEAERLESELIPLGRQALSQHLWPMTQTEESPSAYSEQWLMKKAMEAKNPQWLKMLNAMPGIMPKRYPCVLASVEDCSRLPEKQGFDLVVLDGAESVPAYRGKSPISRGRTLLAIERGQPGDGSCARQLREAGLPVVELVNDYTAQEMVPAPSQMLKGSRLIPGSAIAKRIAAALGSAGYKCRFDAGLCDIVVFAGTGGPQPVCGVMLDTRSLKEHNLCDRELCVSASMAGKGMHLLRLWSPEWWKDPQGCENRLIEKIKSLKPVEQDEAPPPISEEDTANKYEAVDSEPIVTTPVGAKAEHAAKAVYVQVVLTAETPEAGLLEQGSEILLKSKISQVVEGEGPVASSVIAKKVLIACGAKRAGAKLQKRVTQLCDSMELTCTQEGSERFYWPTGVDPNSYSGFRVSTDGRRDPSTIPAQESANAVRAALESQTVLSSTELARQAAYLLGYERMGISVEEAMCRGIEEACMRGKIQKNDDRYFVRGRND